MLYGDERFDNMRFQIFDISKVTKVNAPESDISVIAALDRSSAKWNPNVKVACITEDDYSMQLIEIYASYLMDIEWEVKIFTNFDDALAWCKE